MLGHHQFLSTVKICDLKNASWRSEALRVNLMAHASCTAVMCWPDSSRKLVEIMNPALMRKKLSPPECIGGEWFWRYYEWYSCRFGPVCVLQTLRVLLVCVLRGNEVISTLTLFMKTLLWFLECICLAWATFIFLCFNFILRYFFSFPYLWLKMLVKVSITTNTYC